MHSRTHAGGEGGPKAGPSHSGGGRDGWVCLMKVSSIFYCPVPEARAQGWTGHPGPASLHSSDMCA